MANKSIVMKLANILHFRKSYSRSNVLKTAWKMVRRVKFSSKVVGVTFSLRQSALLWLRKYASSENKRTGRNSVKLIKHFVLWMDKRTPAKRKKQNWKRYFSGQIKV